MTGVPPELEELIARLLSKEPLARAPNALVLSRQLASMEHGLSIVRQRPAENGSSGEGGVTLSPERTVSEHNEPDSMHSSPQRAEPFPPASYDPNAPTLVAPSASVVAAPVPASPANPATAFSVAAPPGAVVAPKSDRTATDKPPIVLPLERIEAPLAAPIVDPKATVVQSRFTTVEEDERRREERERETEGSPAVIQIVLLALSLAMIAGLLWYFMRPPSAETLFVRIEAAVNDSDASSILSAEDDVQSFLERFPDDQHAAAVKRYKDEISLQRLERRFPAAGTRIGERRFAFARGARLYGSDELFAPRSAADD